MKATQYIYSNKRLLDTIVYMDSNTATYVLCNLLMRRINAPKKIKMSTNYLNNGQMVIYGSELLRDGTIYNYVFEGTEIETLPVI